QSRMGAVHPQDFEAAMKAWAEARSRGAPYEVELRIRRHDGVYRWFLVRSLPLKGVTGEITKWFGISTDIHSAKTAQLRAISIQELSASLLRANTREEIVNCIMNEGMHSLGADAIAISWRDPLKNTLKLVASHGYDKKVMQSL